VAVTWLADVVVGNSVEIVQKSSRCFVCASIPWHQEAEDGHGGPRGELRFFDNAHGYSTFPRRLPFVNSAYSTSERMKIHYNLWFMFFLKREYILQPP
jgi:hypothetical protein